MKAVEFRSEIVILPRLCACCTGASDTSVRITKKDLRRLGLSVLLSMAGPTVAGIQRTMALDIPYCTDCKRHLAWKRAGGYSGLIISWPTTLIFAGFVSAILYAMAEIAFGDWFAAHPSLSTWIFVGLALTAATAVPVWNARLRPRGPLGRQHAREDIAVDIVRIAGTVPTLRFYSDSYADQTIGLNPGARQSTPPVASSARVGEGRARRTRGSS